MFVAATLSLLPILIPQNPGSGAPAGGAQDANASSKQEPLLSERDQGNLRKRLREYLAAETEYDEATGVRDREKTGKAREKARVAFEKEWDRFSKKGDLLASMPDLRAMFFNCFKRAKPRHSLGQLHARSDKREGLDWSFFVPKTYREANPLQTLLVLPGTTSADEPAKWTKTKDYFGQVWDKSPLVENTIFHLPQIPAGLEMDPVPDYSREGAGVEEDRRHKTVLLTFGEIMRNYNVDRSRVFLDSGRGTCGYALRMASLFPDRFAGIILRAPIAIDDIRVGSLLGLPILMLRTEATGDVIDGLKQRIEEVSPGTVTVIDAKGAYPHKESGEDIIGWLQDKKPQHDAEPRGAGTKPRSVQQGLLGRHSYRGLAADHSR